MLLNYAAYRFMLHTGILAWQTRRTNQAVKHTDWTLRRNLFPLPDARDLKTILADPGIQKLKSGANEVCLGRYERFGSQVTPFDLSAAGEADWTRYESGRGDTCGKMHPSGDVKYIWEDGRLGWIFPLLRTYRLDADERYAQAFCDLTRQFLDANPPGYGCHWLSAQEVALRLIGLVFACQVMVDSVHFTPTLMARLASAVAEHAARIPPSLAYARAQNNNHLLSEAAGLYTAGVALQDCPRTRFWRETGWRIFNQAILEQINAAGEYIQQSANYQRLVLQLALWVRLLAVDEGRNFPPEVEDRLTASVRWLSALMDRESGGLPNLGPNDGSYILPLTNSPSYDYRPLLHAAALAFLEGHVVETADGAEMALWLCPDRFFGQQPAGMVSRINPVTEEPCVLRLATHRSWAYLRAARFKARPGHADQCHVDLWWRGINIAQDAGTYSYNAAPPWDNPLTQAAVHNTVTLDERDQMRHAGRFLYLDWAQGRIIFTQKTEGVLTATAGHDGYRTLGAFHRRTLTAFEDDHHWVVLDEIIPIRRKVTRRSARLHWLLPDWPWEIVDNLDDRDTASIWLESPHGRIMVIVERLKGSLTGLTLTRAGRRLAGGGEPAEYEGWVSPTYGEKQPALSFAVKCEGELPLTFRTTWQFPTSQE